MLLQQLRSQLDSFWSVSCVKSSQIIYSNRENGHRIQTEFIHFIIVKLNCYLCGYKCEFTK